MTQQGAQTLGFGGIKRPGPHGVEFVASVQRNQVNVNMRHPEPLDHDANANGRHGGSQARRQTRRRRPQCVVVRRVHVKQVVRVALRNQQHVPGVDVFKWKNHEVVGILEQDPLRCAAGDYRAEDAWGRIGHGAR